MQLSYVFFINLWYIIVFIKKRSVVRFSNFFVNLTWFVSHKTFIMFVLIFVYLYIENNKMCSYHEFSSTDIYIFWNTRNPRKKLTNKMKNYKTQILISNLYFLKSFYLGKIKGLIEPFDTRKTKLVNLNMKK